jgi:hypothetical protein
MPAPHKVRAKMLFLGQTKSTRSAVSRDSYSQRYTVHGHCSLRNSCSLAVVQAPHRFRALFWSASASSSSSTPEGPQIPGNVAGGNDFDLPRDARYGKPVRDIVIAAASVGTSLKTRGGPGLKRLDQYSLGSKIQVELRSASVMIQILVWSYRE